MMASKTSVATFDAIVVVTINDPDVIERVTGPEGDDWRAHAYALHTEDDVISHLAYNALVNGIAQVNRLDGWVDLPDDAAVMSVREVDCVSVGEGN